MSDITDDIIKFTQKLVQTPSQNGIETEQAVAELVYEKLTSFGFQPEYLPPDSRPSVMCHIKKSGAKKTVWFEACLDTMPVGDVSLWDYPPFDARIIDGKMFGRGTADAKIAIAIFCFLAKDLGSDPDFNANLFLSFSADEQSGYFTGLHEIIERSPKADLCILGYQGQEDISIGSRGWLRLSLQVFGKQQHTGSRNKNGVNAIHGIIHALSEILNIKIPKKRDEFFWYGPSMHISEISGGIAINFIPDLCQANIDIRLVPGLTDKAIIAKMKKILEKMRKKDKNFEYKLEVLQYEPAYLTDPNNEAVKILQEEAGKALSKDIPLVVSGQGSVGNIISRLGVPIINAFGCEVGNVHEPDEWVNLKTLPKVYDIYREVLLKFCKPH
ncbi:MAG: M20 family metallopeptidase [bacterium]